MLDLSKGKNKSRPKAGPLYSTTRRHDVARRVLDLSLTEILRRLEEDPEAVSAALFSQIARLLSDYEKTLGRDAESEAEQRRRQASAMSDLPTAFADEPDPDLDCEDSLDRVELTDPRFTVPFQEDENDHDDDNDEKENDDNHNV